MKGKVADRMVSGIPQFNCSLLRRYNGLHFVSFELPFLGCLSIKFLFKPSNEYEACQANIPQDNLSPFVSHIIFFVSSSNSDQIFTETKLSPLLI